MNEVEVIISSDSGATETVGERLARRLSPGDVVLLEGDLAAGKTTFIRGLVRGLGGDPESVTSPTFVIVQTYDCNGPISFVHHIDLYRLPEDPSALREIGIEEILADENAVIAVEWPRDLLVDWLPANATPLRVVLTRRPDDARKIEIFPV
ncbi:MAG: tRNA (adenosine(37)-N6)-threonylcarbamoyltransferase complex ATPase subunit type 1 TsaE [Thermoanaerobaculales bacterium]|nr:tRNA (adenosine(37)-N6)-threonylcarbamoyltransferase complex ATPase subunit type 1 TsaE [Thermoanaerobaculales bacterium]